MAMTGGTDKIVKSVKPYSDWPSEIELHVYYKVKSQSVANNTTTLLLGMYVKTPDKYPIGAWSEYYGSYIGTATSGTNCKSFNGAIPNFYGTRWLTENQEVTVAHNADGTKTATIYWKWGVSSDSAYGYSNNSGSFDVPLTTIPRASSVSVSGSVNAGSSLTINVARASSAFTHTLRYVIGNASDTIATGVGTSYAWTVPYDLLKQFRSATSGVGTIYCDTYSGTTKLGTTSCGFTVKAPDNDTTKPSASMMLSPSGDVPKVFSGLYIQGKTAVKADFTATSEYSDIKSCALTVNGKTTAGDPSISETLATNGEVPVVGTVTDTRGYSRTLTENIPVHAYSAPSVAVGAGQTAIVCERAKSNGIPDPAGEYLRIVAKRKYSTVDSKNQCVLRFRYKTSTETSYGSWTTLIAESDETDEYNGIVSNVTFPATTSFDVQIGTLDTMGSETVSTFHIPTDEVSFHIREGGKGAAFFGYSEKDDELSLSGRKITNVGTPADAGDAVPLGYAQGAFAPHGHGLGLATGSLTGLSTPAEADACTKAGWYEYYSSTTLNGSGTQYGGIFVIPSMWSVTQFFFCRMYYGCCMKRIYQDGVWQPWEWINPPMASGVEYRTTERWQGKPVYVKLLSLGNLPNATEKAVYHNIANLDYPLSITAGAKSSDWSFALPLTESSLTKFTFNYQHIAIKCTGNWSGYTAYATLKYTKG